MTAAAHPSNAAIFVSWGAAVLTLGYMLPWAIAESGRKSNSGGVCLVNLLTGWTVIGWIAALVMAVQADKGPPAGVTIVQPGWYPDPSGEATSRFWDGAHWTEHTQ